LYGDALGGTIGLACGGGAPAWGGGGAYWLATVDDGRGMPCPIAGGPLRGDCTRGGALPFGGGGGVEPVRWPKCPAGGGPVGGPVMFDGDVEPGKGEVMGALLGVPRRGGALGTRGTSFQFCMFFDFEGGGTEGVVFRGGAPMGGGPAVLPKLGCGEG
jgi:hypothetical protein